MRYQSWFTREATGHDRESESWLDGTPRQASSHWCLHSMKWLMTRDSGTDSPQWSNCWLKCQWCLNVLSSLETQALDNTLMSKCGHLYYELFHDQNNFPCQLQEDLKIKSYIYFIESIYWKIPFQVFGFGPNEEEVKLRLTDESELWILYAGRILKEWATKGVLSIKNSLPVGLTGGSEDFVAWIHWHDYIQNALH